MEERMVNSTRSAEELTELLDEQVSFLKASCSAFDAGFTGEIKRLAVSVRVLVHDKGRSTSLMTLTNRKTDKFFDSADPYDDNNLISHSSLVQVHMNPTGAIPKAHLDDCIATKVIDFEDWWNGIVLVDAQKNEFTRRDIVLNLANKEGGAHVDHQIDEKYNNLRKNNSQGWITGDETETGMIIRGMSMTVGDQPSELGLPNLRKDRPMIAGRKVGRNDPCPCGSGQKYKKCCLR
jgi:hypothetical protein